MYSEPLDLRDLGSVDLACEVSLLHEAPGLSFSFEESEDLSTWRTGGGMTVHRGTATARMEPEERHRFLRLRIEGPHTRSPGMRITIRRVPRDSRPGDSGETGTP